MEKVDEPKIEADAKKFSFKQIFGLALFLAGVGVVISSYLVCTFTSIGSGTSYNTYHLIGFAVGLATLTMGGGIVIYYEGKGGKETK